MAQIRKDEPRLRLIMKRQWQDHWGADYQPAQQATPREAPGISTGTILRPAKLGRRGFHTLSEAETRAALLALHHPACWDIHEQRILYPGPRAHFLHGHPRAAGIRFPSLRGTIDVCDRLNALQHHPRIQIDDDEGKRQLVPFPYLGDLLLFLEDDQGVYAVNWTVKRKLADFRRRTNPSKPRRLDAPDEPSVLRRHEIEQAYYADAGIRTQQVASETIDDQVYWNLREAFLDDAYPLHLSPEHRGEALQRIAAHIGTDRPAYAVADAVPRKFKLGRRDVIALIRQGIWRRELRIDLFTPLRMDRALRPETEDVFVRFGAWFAR